MIVSFLCNDCAAVARPFLVELRPKNDNVYTVICPNGHRTRANVFYHDFEKHFQAGVQALSESYFRESIGSFAASYERFLELAIRVMARANNIEQEQFARSWNLIAKQSERQLGAFIGLYLLELGVRPPVLSTKLQELRNRVVHQGHFPDQSECLAYGQAVLDAARQVIRAFYESAVHWDALIGAINQTGDLSETGPSTHIYPWPLIGTNRAPDNDEKPLIEMLKYVKTVRGMVDKRAAVLYE